MNRLQALYQQTENIEKLLTSRISSANRQEIIDQLNVLIEKRSELTFSMKPPYTEEEMNIGKQVLSMNEAIEKKMEQLFADLKMEMKQIQQQKKSNQSYINPYKHVQTMDGMYMDKKK
ncbi:flagellar protein FliT [Virgibacillus halophilus]|uniref:Flagellar protein FliT n=1 Tax=Tigheibacillus halophilus TaxID=361280 RepID=A0ABU5C1Q1_9BACI|nr:flagellar protein FliT [Virgibacillus halophilus]